MKHTNDIDRFAEQAGFPARRAFSDLSDLYPRLERFAALIDDAHSKRTFDEGFVTVGHMRERIAAERNKLVQWMIDRSYATGHGDTTEDLLEELDWQITESWSKVIMASVESVREANALLCEQLGAEGYGSLAIAAAIRLKGKE
jgi:hypothetical protein